MYTINTVLKIVVVLDLRPVSI